MSTHITVAEIIGKWPSAEAFGLDLDLKHRGDHARVMKVRGRIPRAHWPRVLEAAKSRGIALTEADLLAAHEQQAAVA
jgi:hypothetical protein